MIQIAPASYHPIQRQNGAQSKQPRFSEVSPNQFFNSIFRFLDANIQAEPVYGDRARDAWLRRVWKLEPYLSGVLNSVVSIDKNRGWFIIGGRNQVKRFVNIFHNRFFFAPDLQGWRMAFGGSALSYYTSDLGSITEVARQGGPRGPLDSLYFTDPARCFLTGDFERPLKYKPSTGQVQVWERNDYFRVVSLPDTDENLYGLGFCALSRCIELAKIMIGIYQYDNEMLLNRAPRGLLLLKGITQEQWEDAMSSRVAKLDGDEKRYYGAVHVLATIDPSVELDAQLVALASLPAEFNQQIFTDLLMYGYALCFGYDPREFWPVSAGALGTATETEAQHRKAGGKGGLDFVLGFAEQLMADNILPDTVHFEFEERDLDGELANAAAEQAKANVTISLYQAGLKEGASLIDREEGRIKLAEDKLIDPDWTENQEETVATDTEDIDRALDSERVRLAIDKYPDDDIVRYRFDGQHHYDVIKVKRIYPVALGRGRFKAVTGFNISPVVWRQIDSELDDYQELLDSLSEQAVDGEITQEDYQAQLNGLTIAILTLSMLRGANGDSEASQLLEDAAILVLGESDNPEALQIGLETLTSPAILEDALTPEAAALLQQEIDGSLQSTLAENIFAGQYDENLEGLRSRLTMWRITAGGLHTFGIWIANPTQRFMWRLGPTDVHCADCARLDEQVHTGAEWAASGWRPQGANLECTGRRCLCGSFETEAETSGGF